MENMVYLFVFVVLLTRLAAVCYAANGCDESSWLCNEFHQMKTLITEQRLINDQQIILIDQLQTRLSKYDQQSRLIDQLQTRLSKYDLVIDAQQKQLAHQNALLLRQETALADERNECAVNREEFQVFKSAVLPFLAAGIRESDEISPPSLSHDVMSRSDDAGPLEAVVNQMSQQMTTMSADIQALKNTDQVLQNVNHQQDLNIQDARTSTFVHWGSTHCPSDAQLVYSGVVGGSHYTQPGGATNYLCLTMSPVPSNHIVPISDAFLYGAEYQTVDSNQDKDVVCAVCRPSHSTTIMIPGTNVCTPGWTKQYDGFLMAGRQIHVQGSEFICVDSALESRPGSEHDDNGAILGLTVAQCGSLPCGPYVNNKIVTCVVCSQ